MYCVVSLYSCTLLGTITYPIPRHRSVIVQGIRAACVFYVLCRVSLLFFVSIWFSIWDDRMFFVFFGRHQCPVPHGRNGAHVGPKGWSGVDSHPRFCWSHSGVTASKCMGCNDRNIRMRFENHIWYEMVKSKPRIGIFGLYLLYKRLNNCKNKRYLIGWLRSMLILFYWLKEM